MSQLSLKQKLELYLEAEILHPIDLEFARVLEIPQKPGNDGLMLAAVLASYWFRRGHVCLEIDEFAGQIVFKDEIFDEPLPEIITPSLDEWKHELKNASFVGQPNDFKPLIFENNSRLYLQKLWHYEQFIGNELLLKSAKWMPNVNLALLKKGLGRYFSSEDLFELNWQQIAAATSVLKQISVISGGPGTGKTTTVVRILALLLEQSIDSDKKLEIALSAPTGKAAARLKESIQQQKQNLSTNEEIRKAIPEKAKTLHQLLGARRHSSTFRYNEDNKLPYNVIVVDEASMIDQTLMSKLMEALPENARLILLGDKDQLASVEAGSVLGDICDIDRNRLSTSMGEKLSGLSLGAVETSVSENPKPLTDNITLLTKSYRFSSESGIAQLAKSINNGKASRAIEILENPKYKDINLVTVSDHEELKSLLQKKALTSFQKLAQSPSVKEAMEVFGRFRLLSPHRRGPLGIEYLNGVVEQLLYSRGIIPKYQQWYNGRPVILNVNDYGLKLHNGDTGICLRDGQGGLKVYFQHESSVRTIAPSRLPAHETAYALTVHKSQGSEFDEVLLILPGKPSKVLSRELLYTAITRARTSVTIVGSKGVLRKGINARLARSSGLKGRLWE